jgi:CheY-like chemotaxis protein
LLISVKHHIDYMQTVFSSCFNVRTAFLAPCPDIIRIFTSNLVPSMFTVNRSPVRLLFVSQNHDLCELYKSLFGAFGCVMAVAHSGKEALAIAETYRPHAVYMSLALGDMRGAELGLTLRRLDLSRDIVLVAVTGHSPQSIAKNGLCVGFDRCITMPVSLPQLILPLAGIINITANLAVSAVVQKSQPTLESQAYAAFRDVILGR